MVCPVPIGLSIVVPRIATAGSATLLLTIPYGAPLQGAVFVTQGGEIFSGGPLLGIASLPPGLEVRI